jgi:hypothetical protein
MPKHPALESHFAIPKSKCQKLVACVFVNLFEQCLVLLCEQLFNDMPMHIGETSFDTVVIECQPCVVNAQ